MLRVRQGRSNGEALKPRISEILVIVEAPTTLEMVRIRSPDSYLFEFTLGERRPYQSFFDDSAVLKLCVEKLDHYQKSANDNKKRNDRFKDGGSLIFARLCQRMDNPAETLAQHATGS